MDNRKILSIDDVSDGDISRLFFAARSFLSGANGKKRRENAVLMTAFFEPSTRTRLSFEMAAHRLSMGISNFQALTSSMSKGESERETLHNLLALAPDVLVIRQSEQLDRALFAKTNALVINGGDGINEHPTQALLDCFTLLNHFQSDDLRKKRIVIIGDIAHSRVARSNIKLMHRLGAHLTLLAPKAFSLSPPDGRAVQVSSYDELEGDYDAIMCLRIQKERIAGLEIADGEFYQNFGLSKLRLSKLGDRCVVLHPGPMNLSVEIDADVAHSSHSLIDAQVRNGVFVRAALMDYYLS